ncbi:hypothetical protein SODG_004545 [Sodalis praecaptivus]|uniref:PAS domain-containing protein n=1 Tax=Sodalis praecaptivus TaxID=1239307 RepID=UPI0027E8C9DB|nr:PAS domain-containing protein [Sodalis praecaptivus]CAJ0993954.1 hypothetical protein NVIRENTERO_01168 [Sodalis praecaptivus]
MENNFSVQGNHSLDRLPLLSLIEKSKVPWAVKSVDSRFAYINESAMDFFNIPAGFNFEGRLDEEFPTPWSEMAEDYKAHDRKAESSPEGAEIITTSCFTRNAVLAPWYCQKSPNHTSENQVIGTFFMQSESILFQFMTFLIN